MGSAQSIPSEGGSGGKRGHSNMVHWYFTEEIKDAARVRRRQEDKSQAREGIAEAVAGPGESDGPVVQGSTRSAV